MIQIEINGKTRQISFDEFMERDIQDILADDIGTDADPLTDFDHDVDITVQIIIDEDI